MNSLITAKPQMIKNNSTGESRLLLCTDMDRTIIPNGAQSEHSLARRQFNEFCNLPQVSLVYVTGRHQKLAKQAIKNYALPEPDYAITDVGTIIYRIQNQQWQEIPDWGIDIEKGWNGKTHSQLKALFSDITELKLQQVDKQNIHKLSYYVSTHVNEKKLLSLMTKRLDEKRVQSSLIWSIDEPKGIGLLDVLPKNATKLHAIEFLRQQLNYSLDEIVFAGDSGNDLPVLASPIPSVLVANASPEVKKTAQRLSNDNPHALFLATGKQTNMNGNYAAGVLEGVSHFAPSFCTHLEQIGFCDEQ